MAEPEGAQPTSTDVRRLIEARLAEVEGMAAIGVLLEGAIHQINNPLASLLASLDDLCERLRYALPADELTEVLRVATEARTDGHRVALAVRELAQLLPSDVPGPLDLNDIVMSVIVSTEKQLGGRVVISRVLGSISPMEGREARLAQVFLNTLSLCFDVASTIAVADPAKLHVATDVQGGRVSVRIKALELPSAADGLLAQSYERRLQLLRGVTQQLGGALVVFPDMLELSLPFAAASFDGEKQVSLHRRESAPPRGELRILVVDDEPSIQRALDRGLKEVGFVQTVRSGHAAVELLEGGATFDVILSDVIMPDGTGIELADWLASNSPALKRRLILMTGMGDMHTDSHPDVMTVGKPFDLVALRELVCQVSNRT